MGLQAITARDLTESLSSLVSEPSPDVLACVSFHPFKAMGFWIDGGPATVLAALRSVFGANVTVVAPTETAQNSKTSSLHLERVAGMNPWQVRLYERWGMRGFHRGSTPSYHMGIFAEYLRRSRGAERSAHPQTSLAALGPAARELTADHQLACHLGWASPIGRLYQREAQIVQLGTEKNLALHLAEYCLPARRRIYSAKVRRRFEPWGHWTSAEDIALDDSDFPALRADLDTQPWVRRAEWHGPRIAVVPLKPAVDYAVDWFSVHRAQLG